MKQTKYGHSLFQHYWNMLQAVVTSVDNRYIMSEAHSSIVLVFYYRYCDSQGQKCDSLRLQRVSNYPPPQFYVI